MGGSEPESECFVTSSNDGDSVRAFLDREVEASSEAFLFPSASSQSRLAQMRECSLLSYISAMSSMIAPAPRYVFHSRKSSRLAIVGRGRKAHKAGCKEMITRMTSDVIPPAVAMTSQ